MRKTIAALALLAAPALPASAQGFGSLATIFGPQYVNYTIGSGAAEKTVSQLSIPIAFILPVSEKLSLDLSAAWADSRVSANGAEASKISGLTDTQLRMNYTLGDNRAVFTLGINAPTGMYKVPDNQQEAAGQIGSNFLSYPISSMGSGMAVTSGVAFASTYRDWNIGLGGSFRYSSPFDAYQVRTNVLRFEPGSETRVRLGLDRAIGDGRISLGGTFSTLADDKVDSTSFATGARALGQAAISYPTPVGDVALSVWNLYRAEGQQVGAVAPWENIVNTNLALGFNAGSLYIQPSVEVRAWMRDFEQAGTLGTGGVRFRFDWLGMSVNPAVSYTIGNVYPGTNSAAIDVKGLRATLLMRIR